jgi:hypothetical protein
MNISLRDYFAGLAMQALITSSDYTNDAIARRAYEMADEMMKWWEDEDQSDA